MNEDHDRIPDGESIDTGQPISALRDLEEDVSDRFMGSLNRGSRREPTDVGRTDPDCARVPESDFF